MTKRKYLLAFVITVLATGLYSWFAWQNALLERDNVIIVFAGIFSLFFALEFLLVILKNEDNPEFFGQLKDHYQVMIVGSSLLIIFGLGNILPMFKVIFTSP